MLESSCVEWWPEGQETRLGRLLEEVKRDRRHKIDGSRDGEKGGWKRHKQTLGSIRWPKEMCYGYCLLPVGLDLRRRLNNKWRL